KTVRVPRRYLTRVCVGCQPEDPTPFPPDPNLLRIGGHSPIKVLVTDPANRTSGDHPDAGVIRQIPHTIVGSTTEPKLIDVEGVEFSGAYKISIFGTDDGNFTLSASGFDGENLKNLAFNLTKTRSITKGEILEAILTVDVSDDGHFEHASLSDFVVVKA